jgi:hypothetical protein
MDLSFIWFLLFVILGVRHVQAQRAFFAARAGKSVSGWVQDVHVALAFTDANPFTFGRERLRELRTPQSDARCEQLRQRANRSLLLLLIVGFGFPLAFAVGAFAYVLWHGLVRA